MRTLLSAIILAWLSADVSAFFPHLPKHYKAARRKEHVANHIAKAMHLEKLSLHRRKVVKRDTLTEMANDFQIALANTPTLPNSAALHEDRADYSYFCQVKLGTDPGLDVYLLMDTGSSVLWVMGDDCTTEGCKDHDMFGPADSSTYKIATDDFFIQYATGNVTGNVITDNVNLAGFNLQMQIGVANTTTDEFANYPMDGILGLGRMPGPGPDLPTFLQVLKQNNLIKENIFGMNLQRASDGTNDGEINFGTIDTSKFTGDINWQNTVGDLARWTVDVDGIMVNGQFTEVSGDRTAIIDTGTSYIYLPPDDAKPIFDAIPGETPIVDGSYVIPCDTNAQISLVFNGIAYELPLKDYVGLPLGPGCVSHIFPLDVVGDAKTWLVGDAFLKNVYSIYDSDQSRVGFGAKGRTQTLTSLVQAATPTVSAGSIQIFSSPAASNTASSPPSAPSDSPPASSSAVAGMLPIGPGSTSNSGPMDLTNNDPMGVTSSTSNTVSSSSSTTSTGASSTLEPRSIVRFTIVFAVLVSVMLL